MNTINSFFEEVFCISLERRREDWYNPATGRIVKGRFAECQGEFSKNNIKVRYVDGVDGLTLNIPKMTSIDGTPVSRGDIGCVLSHLKVVRFAREMKLSNYFVFEDDAELTANFNERFAGYIDQVPADWDMIYLGGNHDLPVSMVAPNVARMHRTFTTHAIAVNHTVYDAMEEVLGRENDKVDICIAELHKRFNCYVFRPHLASQRASWSDILERDADYQHLRE